MGNLDHSVRYAGFWIRTLANIIDTVVFAVIVYLLVMIFMGNLIGDSWVTNFILIGLVIASWFFFQATPGKAILGIKLVSERDHGKLSLAQCIIRYLGYVVSSIPLCLGFIWVAFDSQKQGWHDKMAGTVVIYK